MSDLYLDLRPAPVRRRGLSLAGSALRWFDDFQISRIEWEDGAVIVSRADSPDLWAPAIFGPERRRLIAALAGRVALSGPEWAEGQDSLGEGGLACRAAIEIYRAEGLSGLERLNGNFALLLYDEAERACHLVTDRAGVTPSYSGFGAAAEQVVCTHPDVAALALEEEEAFDLTSLAEFVETGRVTFPHTYYERIRALEPGTIFSFEKTRDGWGRRIARPYFRFAPKFDGTVSEENLADELAQAFRGAVRRRSLGLFGSSALGLSGGLDSRAILCATSEGCRLEAFILIDEPNPELQAARAIAAAGAVPLSVLRREFDHYALGASLGARIGGGTGSLASNHFLRARPWFRKHEIENLLTGCYCDYLFKGLALDTREKSLGREETIAPFRWQFYRPLFGGATRLSAEVEARLEEWIPSALREDESEEALFEIERRRIFPLANEGDCAQRTITQRALPWFAPMADNELLAVYERIPPRLKLNRRLFRAMLERVCLRQVLEVPSSNTGAPLAAGKWARAFYRYRSALANRLQRRRGRLATRGSWPNWNYYLQESRLLREQWQARNAETAEVLAEVVPGELLARSVPSFAPQDTELFLRLWTLQMWLEHRVRPRAGLVRQEEATLAWN